MAESPRFVTEAAEKSVPPVAATAERIETAVATLGSGPLDEEGVRACIAPLFSRVLAAGRGRIYLANHSLGRPLDATEDDVREGVAAWYARMNDAWDAWHAEMDAHRVRLASLLGAERPDCVVPKTSAGQGLRAVLNAFDGVPRVIATRGEFDSLDVILREYARRGRIALTMVEPREGGDFAAEDIVGATAPGVDLVVVSHVMFQTGQRLPGLDKIVARAHAVGARVLLDVYHSLGVFALDVEALDVDFAVGGSYKYLRGGPGACFLAIAPNALAAGFATIDIGWFAKASPFAYERPDPPRYAAGGDAWLESTPAVLPLFQARAGQLFTRAIGVERLRAHSLASQRRLVALLAERGLVARGGTEDHGAFVVVRDARAREWAAALRTRGIVTDARGEWLRFCPDVLTTDAELQAAAAALADVARGSGG
ncbi:MAG TPA: aminotransferase class V-fold PLP-dependent enzyme [Casimicrobiaceae bacterium]|nr:aminotransferase class V-fold PLP-dependent enzyme [Casimicrobiaceae bacterium]